MTYRILTINLWESPIRLQEYRHETTLRADCSPIVGATWGMATIWALPEEVETKRRELLASIVEHIEREQARNETVLREIREMEEQCNSAQ